MFNQKGNTAFVSIQVSKVRTIVKHTSIRGKEKERAKVEQVDKRRMIPY